MEKLKSLTDYIITLDNVLAKEACEQLIAIYDANEKDRVRRDTELMDFSEINMLDSDAYGEFRAPFVKRMQSVAEFYKQHTNCFWPDRIAYEAPRVKRYEPKIGKFDWHIDSATAETGKRLLVMFWYLNDVDVGGETEFDLNGVDMKIPPKQGSVLCFPPNFLFPHRGTTPVSGPKYVISSYVQLP